MAAIGGPLYFMFLGRPPPLTILDPILNYNESYVETVHTEVGWVRGHICLQSRDQLLRVCVA